MNNKILHWQKSMKKVHMLYKEFTQVWKKNGLKIFSQKLN